MSTEMFVCPVELNPGVNGADLEKFWVEEYLPRVSELPGYRVSLHNGDHGKREGQYLFVGHFESTERRHQLHPLRDGQTDPNGSEEWQQWEAANPVFQKLMSHFDFNSMMAEFTQYVDLS